MPPRASWKGQLKLSLVSLPVRLYNAITSTSKVRLNQLHKDCHHRLKQQMICPEHGAVERDEIVKGYEYEKGKYVVVEEDDLEGIKLETNRTIELTQFVEPGELDPILLNAPYYVAPDGPVAEEAFRVIREALRSADRIAIGRVVMNNREHIVAMRVEDKGFRLMTLRYAKEVRSAAPYFEEIKNGEVDQQQLKLAAQLIEQYTRPFEPEEFSDRYQDALLDVIKAKMEGAEPVLVQEEQVGKVINLMDALKKSVAEAGSEAGKKKPPAASVKRSGAKRKKARGA
jgi:DNA end-binding protein Ku